MMAAKNKRAMRKNKRELRNEQGNLNSDQNFRRECIPLESSSEGRGV